MDFLAGLVPAGRGLFIPGFVEKPMVEKRWKRPRKRGHPDRITP
ncbi:MAG: hypothetical protein P8Y66_12220 [Nitrospirota bacterium]|jgi:hypothetical protein